MRKRRIYKAHPSVDGGLCCHACLCVRTQTGASSSRVYHTSYPVSVRRPASLDWASSRPRLATTPLPFSLPSAPRTPGPGTSTPEVVRHARRTRQVSPAALAVRWIPLLCTALINEFFFHSSNTAVFSHLLMLIELSATYYLNLAPRCSCKIENHLGFLL